MENLELEPVVDQLTLDEQISLLSATDVWSLPSIDRLGIGKLRVTDGPNGARGSGSLIGGVKSAAFPVGIALGATWNPALAREVGNALANEARDKGAHVLLAPTVNLHRGALNGRNFECYSEDPILTARIAVGYIAGLQENGVAATVKHFAGNESEIQRTTASSEIDERTLRELYLVPFEAAVREAGVWAVMASYNRLNGTYTSENRWLLTDVLRDDWGFDGLVMSDWWGSHSTVAAILAGLDLEMPGPTRVRGEKLVAAVKAGHVPAAAVRRAALRVLRLLERTGALNDTRGLQEHEQERDATRALIRRAGAEGAVLLKNTGVLPLKTAGKIALIGPNAKIARCMGGGAAQLNAHRQVSPWEGLADVLGEDALSFAQGCTNHRFEPVLNGPFTAEWFNNTDLVGEPVLVNKAEIANAFFFNEVAEGKVDAAAFSVRLTGQFTPDASGIHRVGVHCTGRARVFLDGRQVVEAWESWTPGTTLAEEGCDERIAEVSLLAGDSYRIVIEFCSAKPRIFDFSAYYVGIGRPISNAEIGEAARVAAEADAAILFIGRNAEWDTEGSDLPSMTLPGRQDDLVRAVAAAAKKTIVVLQTGGPVEMPWVNEVDAILQVWYPGQEAGHAIADILLGKVEPGGRLPQSFPVRLADTPTQGRGSAVYPGEGGKVHYAEGLYIGYRHHDRSGTPPLFPFGHGMGYADIEIVDVAVEGSAFETDGRVSIRVSLANTGTRPGAQVIQVYVAPKGAPVDRPEAELKAFVKVFLDPGARHEEMLELSARDFAWYSADRAAWVVSAGSYKLHVGLSAADRRQRLEVSRASELCIDVRR